MKITKLENITTKLNNAKWGTRFYFSNGYMILKTRDDYGFDGTRTLYKLHEGGRYRKGYWGEWRTGNVRESLTEDIPTFGYLNKIEEREDGYRREPMFT